MHAGDRVAILGFTSVDYTTIDIALTQFGAVSVPLQTSAAVTQLQPIVAETEPNADRVEHRPRHDAVELILTGPAPERLVVFDVHPEVDDEREAFEAAKARLAEAGSPVVVETLADALGRGRGRTPAVVADGDDPLALLIYTSGSTGAPKGAMYPESKVAKMWRAGANSHWDDKQGVLPAITLNFLPMSHVMGRGILYSTLASGGTVYFAAKSDLSTFLEDLALIRPTQLNFVPRIWDMLFGEYSNAASTAGWPAAGTAPPSRPRCWPTHGSTCSAAASSAPSPAPRRSLPSSRRGSKSCWTCICWTATARPKPAWCSSTA